MEVKTAIMVDQDINRAVTRIAHEIIENSGDLDNLVLVGVISRGVQIAERISKEIKRAECIFVNFRI